MLKFDEVYGVDISKDSFDVFNTSGIHNQFRNELDGFIAFSTKLTNKSLVAIESTGAYHVGIAEYLHAQGYHVAVLNPLSVKRFIQMKLSKIKTDKSDAKAICEFAQTNPVPLFYPRDKVNKECWQLISLINSYTNQRTALQNKIKAEKVLNVPSRKVYDSIERTLLFLKNERIILDEYLFNLVKKYYPDQLTLLNSIPGIGNKTATFLIVITRGFSRFENSKQLCSYAGITPIIRQSGSSVRGRSRISRMGNKNLRNLLFFCSLSAFKCNKGCKELYERIVGKGKSKKLALIAVCNKLLIQAFAIVKSGLPYDENFVSKLK